MAKKKKAKKAKKKKKKVSKKHPEGGETRLSLNPGSLCKGVKKKKWTGTQTKRKHRPELIGDSYQADVKDLKIIRKLAKKNGISKAEIVRFGVSLAIQVYDAREAGKKTLTVNVQPDDA